jgi:S-adenosylmethionine decarboxylase
LANYLIWSSLAALSAVVTQPTSWIKKIRGVLEPRAKITSSSLVSSEGGWTLIRCDDVDAFNEWLGVDEGLPFHSDEEPSLGSHLLVELYGCNMLSLQSEESVGTAMREAANRSEATVVAHCFHEFKPWGVSGAVIIQESHYTIHTWPEHGYAAIDLFYCGGTVKVHKAVEVLQQRFNPKRIKFLVVRRGLHVEVNR